MNLTIRNIPDDEVVIENLVVENWVSTHKSIVKDATHLRV